VSTVIHIHKKCERLTAVTIEAYILLLSTSYKIFSNSLLSRLKPYADEIIGNHQCGFQCNRTTTDQIFYIRQILEKKWEYNGTVHQLFINLEGVLNGYTYILVTFWLQTDTLPLGTTNVSETFYNMTRVFRILINDPYNSGVI
jgi:hypothetical protein